MPLLLAACNPGPPNIVDPAVFLSGSVAAPERLDYAPVLVQAFAAADLDEAGTIAPGARPFLAASFSGPIAPGAPLPFSLGALGCGRSGRVLAWIDVDGNAAAFGTGGWELDARPGPGDRVAKPRAVWADAAPGTCPGAVGSLDLSADQAVFGVGDQRTRIELDLGAGAAPFQTPFSAYAYRPGDFIKGRPCTSCTPLFTLSSHESVWNTSEPTPHLFEVNAPAVPMRIWLEGTLGGVRYGTRIEPVLFADESGTRGRGAIGLTGTLERL
jgi:hypothetical protein